MGVPNDVTILEVLGVFLTPLAIMCAAFAQCYFIRAGLMQMREASVERNRHLDNLEEMIRQQGEARGASAARRSVQAARRNARGHRRRHSRGIRRHQTSHRKTKPGAPSIKRPGFGRDFSEDSSPGVSALGEEAAAGAEFLGRSDIQIELFPLQAVEKIARAKAQNHPEGGRSHERREDEPLEKRPGNRAAARFGVGGADDCAARR